MDAGRARKLRSVTDLPGAPFTRTMKYGLAVESEIGDVCGLQPGFLQQGHDRIGMSVGQKPLGFPDFRWNRCPRLHADRHLQRFMQ